jgi:hypothetical protein
MDDYAADGARFASHIAMAFIGAAPRRFAIDLRIQGQAMVVAQLISDRILNFL